jgi:(p)ppGpp synthase/HD superfamily hydrolase
VSADVAAWSRPTELGPRFVHALEWAAELHGAQRRKGSDIPYVAHLLEVAALVLDDGGTERQAVAALLHDVLEDTDATRKELRDRFGRKVERIVVACTDIPTGKGKAKQPEVRHHAGNWRKRKRHSLATLTDPAIPTGAVRVRAADALANARSIVSDLRRFGPETWLRFNAGAVDQLWYFRSISVAVAQRLPGLLSDELRVTVREMERLTAWWFDLGDPQTGRRPV